MYFYINKEQDYFKKFHIVVLHYRLGSFETPVRISLHLHTSRLSPDLTFGIFCNNFINDAIRFRFDRGHRYTECQLVVVHLWQMRKAHIRLKQMNLTKWKWLQLTFFIVRNISVYNWSHYCARTAENSETARPSTISCQLSQTMQRLWFSYSNGH